MSSRDAILGRIQTELADVAPVAEPPLAEVWPRGNPSAEQLIERFTGELEAVHGQVVHCGSMEEARRKLDDLMAEFRWMTLGSVNHPICREVAADLRPHRLSWVRDGWQPYEMAELPAGMVAAEWLLADTGTCVVECATPEERLMCYLPPACVVIARVDRLVEHMPAAWDQIARRTADRRRRGELVLITGPSRTADIEKILIVGVHGPKRMVVILID